MHDTVYLLMTYSKRVRNYLGTSLSARRHRYLGLIIFIWEKVCSDQKMLSNIELLIVLMWTVNFDLNQKAAPIDCLATYALTCLWFLSGIRIFLT